MIIGGMPDLHIRAYAPENRIDDYYTTQFRKLDYALNYMKNKGVDIVCFPGDVFNNYGKDPYYLVNAFIFKLEKYRKDMDFVMVLGQHDTRFHDLDNMDTPAQTLISSGVMKLASSVPLVWSGDEEYWELQGQRKYIHDRSDISIQGASWGENVPEPWADSKAFKILVIHKMIIEEQKLWEGQEEYAKAERFLDRSGFDLVISGDNHRSFSVVGRNNSVLFNGGSLCRMSKDQETHTPGFLIFDTEKKLWETPEIPIEKFDKVMSPESIQEVLDQEQEEESREYLASFVSNLKESLEGKVSFKKVLSRLAQNEDQSVKTVIERCFGNG